MANALVRLEFRITHQIKFLDTLLIEEWIGTFNKSDVGKTLLIGYN